MTEAEWLASPEILLMLNHVQRRTSDRKLRLWACACLRRIWHLIPHELGRRAVTVLERVADREASHAEWLAVADAFAPCGLYNSAYGHPAMRAAHAALYSETIGQVAYHSIAARKRAERIPEKLVHAELLRHIVGNPFRPLAEATWSPTVTALAESLYSGQDCGFALHDALLEAGYAELAEHFRGETSHPRGCWALDHILGKS